MNEALIRIMNVAFYFCISQASGLSEWIGQKMTPLADVHPLLANLCCLLVICALTQCTSNTATATVFLPILAELVRHLYEISGYLLIQHFVSTGQFMTCCKAAVHRFRFIHISSNSFRFPQI